MIVSFPLIRMRCTNRIPTDFNGEVLATGEMLAAACVAAGIHAVCWRDGVVTVGAKLRLYPRLDGEEVLVDITVEDDEIEGVRHTLVEGLEPLPDDIVDRVRATLEHLDGGAA